MPSPAARALLLLGGSGVGRALLKSLTAYWPLDEASGTRRDQSDNAFTLADNNTVTGNPGPTSKLPLASQFTAANSEWLSIASTALLQTGGIDYTCAGWFYLDSYAAVSGTRMLVSKFGTNKEFRIGLLNNAGTTVLFHGIWHADNGAETFCSSTFGQPALATWYFWCSRYDSVHGKVALTINNFTNVVNYALGSRSGTTDFRIGSDNGTGGFWDGRQVATGFWTRYLSDTEVVYLAQGRTFVPGKGFV